MYSEDCWYYCWCQSKNDPVYMTSPDDPRPVPEFRGKRVKKEKHFVNPTGEQFDE